MILTPHAIVGAALANMFPNEPVLGFSLAFVSHYALDMLPHSQYEISNLLDDDTKTIKSIFKHTRAALNFLVITFDFVLAIILCILFFVRDEKSALITLVGITGGVLPDFLTFLRYKFQTLVRITDKHIKLQNHVGREVSDKILGVFFQIFVPICFLIIYFIIKNKLMCGL